jgi:hypothetical protein
MTRRRRNELSFKATIYFVVVAFAALGLAILLGLPEAFGEWAIGLLKPS